MALKVSVSSTAEPITLLDAKDHLRVSSSADDPLIMSYIAAARDWIENRTRRTCANKTYHLTLDDWPLGGEIVLPRSPLNGSTRVIVQYLPTTAASTGYLTLASTNYIVDDQNEPGKLVLKSANAWPTASLKAANAVRVTFRAGYDASTDIPVGIRHAVKLMVGDLYENREGGGTGQRAIDSLLAAHRVPTVP